MQVFGIVFAIALSTALLAAAIVALDLDLAIIRAWRSLTEPQRSAASATDWTNERQPVWTAAAWMPAAVRDDAGVQVPVASGRVGDTEAERWLAAASANRLTEYRAGETMPGETMPATPLRDLLARRRAEQYDDEAAAA